MYIYIYIYTYYQFTRTPFTGCPGAPPPFTGVRGWERGRPQQGSLSKTALSSAPPLMFFFSLCVFIVVKVLLFML